MSSRRLGTVAAAAAIAFCVPAARAERVPTKPVDPSYEQVFDSDPWRPDAGDPYGTVSAVRNARTPETQTVSAAARPSSWWRFVLRMLRTLTLGGLPR